MISRNVNQGNLNIDWLLGGTKKFLRDFPSSPVVKSPCCQ